jgi:hypothetical protein
MATTAKRAPRTASARRVRRERLTIVKAGHRNRGIVTDSKELQELRRRLRAAFNVERIVANQSRSETICCAFR